jgi:hypothetical protein
MAIRSLPRARAIPSNEHSTVNALTESNARNLVISRDRNSSRPSGDASFPALVTWFYLRERHGEKERRTVFAAL